MIPLPEKATTMKAVGISSVVGLLYGIDPTTFVSILSKTAQSQIAQAGFFFTAAAWLHAGRVKKEIKENFVIMTDAINNVALALRQDLAAQTNRLDILSNRVDALEHKP